MYGAFHMYAHTAQQSHANLKSRDQSPPIKVTCSGYCHLNMHCMILRIIEQFCRLPKQVTDWLIHIHMNSALFLRDYQSILYKDHNHKSLLAWPQRPCLGVYFVKRFFFTNFTQLISISSFSIISTGICSRLQYCHFGEYLWTRANYTGRNA